MTHGGWVEVKAVFERMLDLAPEQRRAYLDRLRIDRPALCAEVEALLAADERAGSDTADLGALAPALLQALGEDSDQQEQDDLVGIRLGPWRLLRQIGRGGMGAVYLAERDDGEYLQQAAVKLMRSGWDDAGLLPRFRAERQILASLSHPNIARLVDGGVSAAGKPYLVLEYIEGEDIAGYCNRRQLGLEARLQLFLTVCDAVDHAHRRLVVHRDLKPSNILVDGTGQVKLLDFGIAKLMQADTDATVSALRLFTPEYAAPEQVRGDPVTTGVDVYALGLLLYELLTGSRPYGEAPSTPAAYEQAILSQQPPRPSRAAVTGAAAAQSRAAARALDPQRLARLLRGDLDAIVLKALRKEPEQRYPAVAELAADIQRHLERQPVGARRGNFRYLGARFLQRHALAALLASLALLSLTGGLAIALWQTQQARLQRDLARAEAANASEVARFVTGVFAAADPRNTDGREATARDLLTTALAELEDRPDLQPETQAALQMALGHGFLGVGDYPQGLQLMQRAKASAASGSSLRLQVETSQALGLAYNRNHQNAEALSEYIAAEALAGGTADLDPMLLEVNDYMIGLQLHTLNQRDAAMPYLQRAYEGRAQRLDAGAAEAVETMTMYAYALANRKQLEAARAVVEPAYAALQAQPLMPLHRQKEIIAVRAYLLLQSEQMAEAEAMFRRALEIDEQLFGVGDERTAVQLNNLAVCLSRQQRYAEAADLLDRVVAIRRTTGETGLPQLAFALVNSGSFLYQAGQLQPAIGNLREAVNLYCELQQPDERQSIKGRFLLARALEADGAFEDALALSQELQSSSAALGESYLYARDAEPNLLHARLLTRLARMPVDCAPAAAVLAIAEATAAEQAEAQVLAAHCELLHGRGEEARQQLAQLGDAAAAAGLSDYARALLTDIRGIPVDSQRP